MRRFDMLGVFARAREGSRQKSKMKLRWIMVVAVDDSAMIKWLAKRE
jgi:hypothetical protein